MFTLPEVAAARAFAAALTRAQETPSHATIRGLAEAAIRLADTFARTFSRDLPTTALVDLLIVNGLRAADMEVDLTPGPTTGPAAAQRARLAEIDALILAPQNTLTLAQAQALMAERAAIRAALAG